MCGICGIVNLDGRSIAPEVLRRMTASLAHRGPDGEGEWFTSANGSPGPAVGLGHRRLAVIDLSQKASQPMTNRDRSLAIVFNGEIYNFRALRGQLQANGHAFHSNSDTEVILHLYAEVGPKCVDELDGMFAFAIWDARQRRLFLARDRAGKKPLYYVMAGTTFVFGSEVKALLRHPAVSGEVAIESLPHYFVFGYPPPGRAFHEGVQQVPPAHIMTVEADGRIASQRYWDLDFSRQLSDRVSLPDISAQVRALTTEAVRKRLVADVPLGAFLSGGMDSSIVVGLMSQLSDRPVKTFTIGFTGDHDFNETPYARLVADKFGTDHHEILLEPTLIDSVESLVRHYDGPLVDQAALPTYMLSRITRRHVTVALNGEGGDELFAGYLRFQACLAAEHVPPALSRLSHLMLSAFPEPTSYHHWLRRAQRFFAAASRPLLGRMKRWVSIFPDEDLPRLLRPDVFGGMTGTAVGYAADMLAQTAAFSPLSKLLYINFMTYLPDGLLVKLDRMTMAHGLEGRSPFLDHRLAEYLASLPDRYKLRGGATKRILRTAFADLLPAQVLRRGKKGFGVPLGTWFRGELREYLHDLLLSPDARSRRYLVSPYVEGLVREHTDGTTDHSQRLWALLTFEVWLRLIQRKAEG